MHIRLEPYVHIWVLQQIRLRQCHSSHTGEHLPLAFLFSMLSMVKVPSVFVCSTAKQAAPACFGILADCHPWASTPIYFKYRGSCCGAYSSCLSCVHDAVKFIEHCLWLLTTQGKTCSSWLKYCCAMQCRALVSRHSGHSAAAPKSYEGAILHKPSPKGPGR